MPMPSRLSHALAALVACLGLAAAAPAASAPPEPAPMLESLGFDPAVLSAPFITTIVDASGLVIYFLIAKLVLGV